MQVATHSNGNIENWEQTIDNGEKNGELNGYVGVAAKMKPVPKVCLTGSTQRVLK